MLTISTIIGLLSGPLGYVAVAALGALGLFGLGMRSKRAGRAEVRSEVRENTAKAEANQAKVRLGVGDEVSSLPPDARRYRLLGWATPIDKSNVHRLEDDQAKRP